MLNNLDFLKGGAYTEITDLVKEIASGLNGRRAISDYVSSLKSDKANKKAEFRKRTASEILKSGYVTGCSDRGIVFLALARASGIPARYVETIHDIQYIENSRMVYGHVFVDLFIEGRWYPFEPVKGFTKVEDGAYLLNGNKYFEIGKGLDFSQVYIKENGVYRKNPVIIQSLDDIVHFGSKVIKKQK